MPTRPDVSRPARPAARGAGGRASTRPRGYSPQWDRAARLFLAQHPLCYYCGLLGRVEAARHVDHYHPTDPHTPAFFDRSN